MLRCMHIIYSLILSSSIIIWFGANPIAQGGDPTFLRSFWSRHWVLSIIRQRVLCKKCLCQTVKHCKIPKGRQVPPAPAHRLENWGKEHFMQPGSQWQVKKQSCWCLASCGSQEMEQLPVLFLLFRSSVTIFCLTGLSIVFISGFIGNTGWQGLCETAWGCGLHLQGAAQHTRFQVRNTRGKCSSS